MTTLALGASGATLLGVEVVGEIHPAKGATENVFSVAELVAGEQAAGPAAETGCQIKYPGT